MGIRQSTLVLADTLECKTNCQKCKKRKFKKIFIVSDGRHTNPDTFKTPYFFFFFYTNRPSLNSNEIRELAHRNRILLKPFSRVRYEGCVKRLRSEPRQKQFWVRSARTCFWWNNVQSGLAIVFDVHVVTT